MWVPKRYRRQLAEISADADKRLRDAREVHGKAVERAAVVRELAATSARLAKQNSFAALIRDSLLPAPARRDDNNH